MNYADYKDLLKKGPPEGVFLFYGEEDYLKRHCLTATRAAVLEEGTEPFNHTVLDGSDPSFGAADLAAAASALPVMAERTLVEVRGLSLLHLTEAATTRLTAAIDEAAENPTAVVILYTEPDEFDPGTEKKPSALLKTLEKHLTAVAFLPETPQRLKLWVQKHFHAEKLVADAELCGRIVARSGRDMYTLAGETEKLCAYLHAAGRDKLTAQDIDAVTAVNAEFGAFDFANAMLDGNAGRAYEILDTMKKNREEPVAVLGAISRVFCDLCLIRTLTDAGLAPRAIAAKLKRHEYAVTLYARVAARQGSDAWDKAVELCYQTDVKMKSLPIDGYLLIDRLVASLSALRTAGVGKGAR